MDRTPTHDDSAAMLSSLVPIPVEDLAWWSLLGRFDRALMSLSSEERVFLKLWLLHGASPDEIARAFHLDARTFRRRFHRLLARLRRLVSYRVGVGAMRCLVSTSA